ncbi:3-isopropylmalate dehydratase small subunit [Tengunoibacter tsumagoiensis]|uniref:3-isopropylmalate dehydratase small subunit n=1 Tax=Tengunoibacter tsumagoiensis TaxID=2014871 RepID=A0A401ZVS0_9CHLR|nr:3-isopropylmalate dehydratase small subunit [Tengunoibacter tsumagoiensis]GCE10896.1 3-isopropylmalate dehydratase small subunit [Tengunoibacter tsumagoiensis]
MQAFTQHHGIVMPLNRDNVDTDAIIPASYLKSVSRTGYAEGLFSYWRYRSGSREPDPNFELNMPRYGEATILLARTNFGCGSSREHAPWALYEYGFRTVIAASFADIFYNNCFNVGVLPIRLPEKSIQTLFEEIEATPGYALFVDLEAQSVLAPNGHTYSFDIDPFRKSILLQGLDPVARTLQFKDEITAFEVQRQTIAPWYDVV